MGELFVKGGILMWPLLACSVAALAVVIERVFRVRPKKRGRKHKRHSDRLAKKLLRTQAT